MEAYPPKVDNPFFFCYGEFKLFCCEDNPAILQVKHVFRSVPCNHTIDLQWPGSLVYANYNSTISTLKRREKKRPKSALTVSTTVGGLATMHEEISRLQTHSHAYLHNS